MMEKQQAEALRKAELSVIVFKEGISSIGSRNLHLTLNDYSLLGEIASELEARLGAAQNAAERSAHR